MRGRQAHNRASYNRDPLDADAYRPLLCGRPLAPWAHEFRAFNDTTGAGTVN
jgi:hypothetical protein